jgi:hypothetical protein
MACSLNVLTTARLLPALLLLPLPADQGKQGQDSSQGSNY